MKQKIFIFLFFCLLSFAPGYSQTASYIRVAILDNAKSLNLKAKGSYEVTDISRKKILLQGNNLKTTVTVYRDAISLGQKSFRKNKIFIKTREPDEIIINGRAFRGDVELIKSDNSLLVVNYIELEDYIKGVLYHEASHYWPQEVLKAQAIACRTYALYQMQENKRNDYDVTNDIYSQVYGGRTSERYRTNQMVDETRGLILKFKGKIFPAYYHATCAGHTEDASLLWNINIAPLKGVACDFCKDSPHFDWHLVLSLEEIKDKLAQAGYKVKAIKDIVILGHDTSGRITDLSIVSDKELKLPAKDFRSIIGPNLIRSAKFQVNIADKDAVFMGTGWGHGVGLCQWGAYFMAKQGKNYKEILKYYYPGSNVETF
ncbi:MAG: SpoIID/LytB domain-containing protein [Candidatus Omnitrophica bacterium]|nr:SpoIID/LytB domain-containing protein [Candidatus Omnitrophota bacterium]MDD5237404.1 SpoIID/LytB domain-containing protein [Candidatus Omnitrophota bacterium]